MAIAVANHANTPVLKKNKHLFLTMEESFLFLNMVGICLLETKY